ncbi:MAG: T9SS type A sorting domain-containing protein [Candidatus Eisenbacteria bacterium]|uniref:T9SS type A sorting domain-containing protein n=1 Tax=Eiseniibacteriota bacterium TaxID=2212470 RepID=A0A956M021_UNCEI|nr:T9SS type A sorting domain-containing protein [Candidatus Eisenbacteria bacterium]
MTKTFLAASTALGAILIAGAAFADSTLRLQDYLDERGRIDIQAAIDAGAEGDFDLQGYQVGVDDSGQLIATALSGGWEDAGFSEPAPIRYEDGGTPWDLDHVTAILVKSTKVYVAYVADLGGIDGAQVYCWDGTDWAPVSNGFFGRINDMAWYGDHLVIGGTFELNYDPYYLLYFDSGFWFALGGDTNGPVHDLETVGSDLVVGGSFTQVATTSANNIAKWNGTSWSGYGSGTSGTVETICSFNGDLFVGGQFSAAGGSSAPSIAYWDGSNWNSVGGTDGEVRDFEPFGSQLALVGTFTEVGSSSLAANGVAALSWSGSAYTWGNLGGFSEDDRPFVKSLCSYTYSGQEYLVAAGRDFGGSITEGGRPRYWNGTNWQSFVYPLRNDLPLRGTRWDEYVNVVVADGNRVYMGGAFTTIDQTVLANHIAYLDAGTYGSHATPLGKGADGPIRTLQLHGTTLYAGGDFFSFGGYSPGIARLGNWGWSTVGGGLPEVDWGDMIFNNTDHVSVRAMATWHNRLVVGGSFYGLAHNNILAWNSLGNTWEGIGSSSYCQPDALHGTVEALASYNGLLYMGGNFTFDCDVTDEYSSKNLVALVYSGDIHIVGELSPEADSTVYALQTFDGELYAGGKFTTIGSVSANGIAKYDGTDWSALGDGIEPSGGNAVYALAVDPTGEERLYIGGHFDEVDGASAYGMASWTGSAFETLPWGDGIRNSDGSVGYVYSFRDFDDELVIGGSFATAGGPFSYRANICSAKYNSFTGSFTYSQLGSGTDGPVYALGKVGLKLHVGGDFVGAGGMTGSHSHYATWSEPASRGVEPASAGGVGAPSLELAAGPNPVRDATTLRFTLDRDEDVSLEIFDIGGRRVAQLLDERMLAGPHSIEWRGPGETKLGSGVYFARIRAGSVTNTARLVVQREN